MSHSPATSLHKSRAKHLLRPSHLSAVRLGSLKRFQLGGNVAAAPPISNKVKINAKVALIFKVSYSIPCSTVCEEIRVISLRTCSQLPAQASAR